MRANFLILFPLQSTSYGETAYMFGCFFKPFAFDHEGAGFQGCHGGAMTGTINIAHKHGLRAITVWADRHIMQIYILL